MSTRRDFLALGLAGAACALPLAATGAQAQTATVGAIRINAAPLVEQGWGAFVDQARAELQRTLIETLGPAYQPNSGTTLIVTLRNMWLASYAGGGSRQSDGGASNDYLDSVAIIVDRKGRELARYPILSTELSSSGGAWYRPGVDQLRVNALARNNALWIGRYVKGGGSLF